MFNFNEVALSDTRLTAHESIGGICSSYFGDRRQHQVPRDWPSAVTRFLSKSDSANVRRATSSRPSSSRAAPSRSGHGPSSVLAG